VQSLIAYTTLCDYMLVPTQEGELKHDAKGNALKYPEHIPGYGKRGWCRSEYFIFSLWAEVQALSKVQLYAATREGALTHYPAVRIPSQDTMPSGGDFTVESDKAIVMKIEDTMIEEYGKAIIRHKCAAAGDHKVDLSNKVIRAVHVPTLSEEVRRHGVVSVDLHQNQLRAEGGAALAKVLNEMASLATLKCALPFSHLAYRLSAAADTCLLSLPAASPITSSVASTTGAMAPTRPKASSC
jgi:hypothetical protein